jgi:hypothetical protein
MSKLSNRRLEQDLSYETRAAEMRSNGNSSTREENICIHIFTVSSAMVGVCLTVIGLIRVVITLGRADNLADDFLAGDALLFLASCLLSYTALRSKVSSRMHKIERLADIIFITAMIAMVVICGFITYAVALPSLPAH